jgi:CheY-like chemotaxis protein
MTHRVLLVGGSLMERKRLESTLGQSGHAALSADGSSEAALMCRQFGPSVILLLADMRTLEAQGRLALLANHPATASVPLAAMDVGLDAATAITLLKTLSGLVPPPQAVATLNDLFGVDSHDRRRRLSFQRRGPTTLRRMVEYLRRTGASGTLVIDGPLSPARIQLRKGHIEDSVAGAINGPAAVQALFDHSDDAPWGFALAPAAEGSTSSSIPTSIELELNDIGPDDADGHAANVANAADGSVAVAVHESTGFDGHGLPSLPSLPSRHDVARGQLTMVLVDDDQALVTMYRRTFEHAGYVVHTADNGAHGYDCAVAVRPDVIVSDIAMPGKNGWDLLSMVRADPRLREIPFVLLSCHDDFLRGLQKASAGADAYVEKGIRATALKDLVDAAAEARVRLASWNDVPPPSFRERAGAMGLFAVMTALERSRADGEVVVDDGWVAVRLHLVGGVLVHAAALEADGKTLDGLEALVAAVGRQEVDIEFRAGEGQLGSPTMSRSPTDALETAAVAFSERRRLEREQALGDNARLRFKEAPARLYFLVADAMSQAVARRFEAGASPRELLSSGEVDPLLMEWVVSDLLHKGIAELELA